MKPIIIDRSYFFKNIRYKWRTSSGKEIYVDELGSDHIRNIYNLIKDINRSFPDVYLGYSRGQWLQVLELELSKRKGGYVKQTYKHSKPNPNTPKRSWRRFSNIPVV